MAKGQPSLREMLEDARIEEYAVVDEAIEVAENATPGEVPDTDYFSEMVEDDNQERRNSADLYRGTSRINMLKMAYLHMQGYTSKEIAAELRCSPEVVQDMRKTDKFKALIAAMNTEIIATARVFMASASIKAVKTLIQMLDSPNDKVKLGAASELLNRVGLKSPDKLEILQTTTEIEKMSDDELLNIVKLGAAELLPASRGNDNVQNSSAAGSGSKIRAVEKASME